MVKINPPKNRKPNRAQGLISEDPISIENNGRSPTPKHNAEGKIHPMMSRAEHARDTEGFTPMSSKLTNWDPAN